MTVVNPAVFTGLLVCNLGQIPSTTVQHVRRTLHHRVIELQCIVYIYFIEGPFVLEPGLHITHVDAVVVAEATTVRFGDRVIVFCDLVLTNVDDILLGETAVGSQLLDITVCEGIDIDPLVCTQQVVDGLVVDTLRELTLYAQRHLEVVILRVDIVKRSIRLLDVIVTTLQHITCRSGRVIGIIGVVRRIDVIPVDLGGLVITIAPEVNEVVILVFVNRRTYQITIVADETGTQVNALHVFSDEQSPRIVVPVVVEELTSRSLVVRVCNLTIPIEGRQVTIVVRTRIGCVEEVQCRVGIPRVVVTCSRFEFLLIVDLVLISHNDRRIIRLHDTAVTNLTVLVAPIGVVVDRSGQVIHLLCNRSILATLGRSTKGDQFQTCVVPDLLCRQEVTQRIVLDTFADDTLVVHIRGETIGQLCGNSPSACHHATRISSVHTRFVVTVGTCNTYFPALCIAAGSHQVVGRLTKSTEGEVSSLHRVKNLFVTACVIQTTHGRVVELTALLRTEVQPLDVVVLTIGLIPTIAITRCGPGK